MFKRLRMAAAGFGVLAATAMPAFSQGTLRIGMTAADIPQTTGQPDQGFEGYRFAGYTIYDGLVNWDLSKADTIADIKPGLATEWAPVEGDPKRWIFKLRQGVKFHDGSDFDADVVVWNLEKILNDKSPQFDPKQAAQARGRVPTLVAWKAIDKHTVELSTRVVNALFPYDMSYIFYSSPTQWEKLGKDWVKFAVQPVGTGPFKVDRMVPRERLELSRFDGYWDKSRVPKLDKVLLFPMPEAAKKLLAEAGYSATKKPKIKIAISTSGSGQMLPLPMNEYVQENLNAVGFDTTFEVMEWNALVTFGFQPVTGDASTKAGTNGINISRATVDPYSAFMRLYHSEYVPPKGANWGILKDPKLDELINKAHTSFERAAQTKALADVHTYIVDQSYWVYIAHDLNPRAMSPKVKGFVQAQSWFQDLTPIEMAK